MAPNGRVGLVLAGGGARGAYEVGALSALLPALEARGERPSIFVGTSVGAINAAALAATRHLPVDEAIERELSRWLEVDRKAVIEPVLQGLPVTALRFAGGVAGVPGLRLRSLLDPSPLQQNLRRWIDWRRLHRNIADGDARALSVVATAARSGRPVCFVEGRLERRGRTSHVEYVHARIDSTHLRASAAIPILFPPVRVRRPAAARGWYVDGATRLNTPIKPAIDLGAERIAVIAAASVSPPRRHAGRHDAEEPDFAVTAGLLLHGALSDPLIEDLRRLGDINSYYAQRSQAPAAVRERRAHGRPPYRRIPYVLIAPREPDAIGRLATECFHSRYGGLRALRSPDLFALGRLLGGDGSAHGELLSYLLFDPEFIRGLVELGREDAKAWLELGNGADGPWQQEPLDTLRPTGVAA